MNNEINKYFLPVAVVVAGLLIAGAVMWNGSRPVDSTGSPQAGTAPKVNIKDVKTDGNPFIGQASAPVTIAVWSDFQCPFCKRFETETLPLIVKDYVDAGKVKVVMMDFAFLGPDSTAAGEYNRAVWK
ncbi:MAG: thioredoxin domain-containing protein, partial [Patescibacteria group bacterium]